MKRNTDIQGTVAEVSSTKMLVINGLFIGLTFAATMFINIRLPLMGSGGLIHLGNVPLFIGALIYGRKTGAIAGAFGMALFDMVSGWAIWAPFTFVIVGAMGYIVGLVGEKLSVENTLSGSLARKISLKPGTVSLISIALALIIKVVGYYFAEVIIYGNWVLPLGSVPGNVMQIIVAAIIALPLVGRLKPMALR